MKRAIIGAVAFLSTSPAWAQNSMSSQISTIYAAQQRHEQAEQAERAVQEEAALSEQRQAQEAARERAALNARHQHELEAHQQLLEAQEQARRDAQTTAEQAARKRDDDYEDQNRAINLQERMVQLKVEQARAARSNDFIDHELQQKAAENDVIQSQADATRNFSSGARTLMEKTGDAEVASQSGLFH